jgi:hypothetical protein
MTTLHLTIPDEPLALKTLARTLLEQAPEQGLPLVLEGRWIADPLWAAWGDDLDARGLNRERFGEIVADYANELRLWVVGERPWAQAAGGLAGRVARRVPAATMAADDPERGAAWEIALHRVGIAPDSDMATLTARIGDLQLLYDIPTGAAPGPSYRESRAIVWAGARPRDPEAPFGESRPGATGAAAVAEALGYFLLKDPAYPPR